MRAIEMQIMLISFVWVVGLTRILECFGALWVARGRVRFAASHIAWMAAILIDILGNWLVVVGLGDRTPFWVFIALLIYGLGLFFAATVVSPRVPADGVLDLAAYESEEGAAYKITFIFLMLLALPIGYGINNPLHAPVTIGFFLEKTWSVTATLAVFAIGLARNRRVRTAAAFTALLLALYGFIGNVIFSGTPLAGR